MMKQLCITKKTFGWAKLWETHTVKSVLKWPLKKTIKIDFQYQLLLKGDGNPDDYYNFYERS